MNTPKRLITLVALFTLIFSLVAFAADDTRYVKVIAYDVNIRAGASTEHAVIGQAAYGDSYSVVSSGNGWYQVRLKNGQTGYISSSLVNEGGRFTTSNPTIEVVEATQAAVNVRGGPSTTYDIIGNISQGTTYPRLQTSGEWVQIRLPGERIGWVAKWLVKVTEDTAKHTAKAEQQKGTVVVDTLNVRQDKSTTAHILGTLKQGDVVKVLGESGDWTSIEFQGKTGYAKSEFIRLPQESAPQAEPAKAPSKGPTLTLKETANIRSGPGTNFTLLQSGERGDVFSITGKSGQWYEVALQSGKRAWIAGWLADVKGSTLTIPEHSKSLDQYLRGKSIVLDPGHGGIDVGAVGTTTSVYEKDLNLSITRMLYNKLQSTGASVTMTRYDDRFVTLEDRVALSRNNQADLFISMHYNTNMDPNLSGSMTFYYEQMGEDHRLAKLVQEELTKSLKLPDLGARYGDYYVLRENPQTAILVETAFLTHKGDEQISQDLAAQERAAEGVFQAVIRYFESAK